MDANPADATPEELRARIADLEAELEQLRRQTRIEREHDQLRHQEHTLGQLIENEAMREKNRLLTKRTIRLKERLEETKRDAKRGEKALRAELDAVYASRTWKAGRLVARPARRRR